MNSFMLAGRLAWLNSMVLEMFNYSSAEVSNKSLILVNNGAFFETQLEYSGL